MTASAQLDSPELSALCTSTSKFERPSLQECCPVNAHPPIWSGLFRPSTSFSPSISLASCLTTCTSAPVISPWCPWVWGSCCAHFSGHACAVTLPAGPRNAHIVRQLKFINIYIHLCRNLLFLKIRLAMCMPTLWTLTLFLRSILCLDCCFWQDYRIAESLSDGWHHSWWIHKYRCPWLCGVLQCPTWHHLRLWTSLHCINMESLKCLL